MFRTELEDIRFKLGPTRREPEPRGRKLHTCGLEFAGGVWSLLRHDSSLERRTRAWGEAVQACRERLHLEPKLLKLDPERENQAEACLSRRVFCVGGCGEHILARDALKEIFKHMASLRD